MLTVAPSFLHERAEQLASVFLTRRDDIAVERQPQSFRVDLLASLRDGKKATNQVFGVEVRAVDADQSQANGALRQAAQSGGARLDGIPFPVCVFVFTMHDDVGSWRWLRAPDPDPSRRRNLLVSPTLDLQPLTDDALDDLVASVRAWYQH